MQRKKRLTKGSKVRRGRRGVIFVKHIPHGFFEPQMKRWVAMVIKIIILVIGIIIKIKMN